MSRSGREPTEEELALWRYVTRDVTPQPGRLRISPHPSDTDQVSPEKSDNALSAVPQTKRTSVAAKLPPLSLGATAGLDRRMAQRFARGQLEIEGRLDLHGLNVNQAHSAVAGFVTASAQSGRRCVLIITGKGGGPSENAGRIRREALHWLSHPALRLWILAVREARPHHGGGGALYVLLKRQRQS